jgi:hypothetical protein
MWLYGACVCVRVPCEEGSNSAHLRVRCEGKRRENVREVTEKSSIFLTHLAGPWSFQPKDSCSDVSRQPFSLSLFLSLTLSLSPSLSLSPDSCPPTHSSAPTHQIPGMFSGFVVLEQCEGVLLLGVVTNGQVSTASSFSLPSAGCLSVLVVSSVFTVIFMKPGFCEFVCLQSLCWMLCAAHFACAHCCLHETCVSRCQRLCACLSVFLVLSVFTVVFMRPLCLVVSGSGCVRGPSACSCSSHCSSCCAVQIVRL